MDNALGAPTPRNVDAQGSRHLAFDAKFRMSLSPSNTLGRLGFEANWRREGSYTLITHSQTQ